jgi:tRNA G10  N-methylase Trm11
VIQHTSVDCNHSLNNVHVIFRDIDDNIYTLEIDQALAHYGVADYRIYKRDIKNIDLTKHSFFFLSCNTYNNEHDWKENKYGYVTEIHPWMY